MSLNARCVELLSADLAEAGGAASVGTAGGTTWLSALQQWLGASLVGVVLFGSRARGDARPDSDTDLLIVVGDDVPLRRELYSWWDQRFPQDLSPHFVHLPADAAGSGVLWLESSIDGILLYDTARRVASLLARIRREAVEGRLIRRMAHGHPYWVRRSPEEVDAQ